MRRINSCSRVSSGTGFSTELDPTTIAIAIFPSGRN
jgi:hypothetical protein